MLTLFRRFVLILAMLPVAMAGAESVDLAPVDPARVMRAELRTDRPIVQSGRPVWVEFALVNLTDHPLTLRLPDTPMDETVTEEMGLPLAHVFSGESFTAISVKDSRGETFDSAVSLNPRAPVPTVRLAPFSSVGVLVDLTRYYEALLHRPGRYTLVWRPYKGSVESAPLEITLMAERQAVIMTRFGNMTMRFYYDLAPLHVQNFIELVEERFYDNLTFHRVIPGGLIQGGDPLGDGRGVRPDGKRVPAEFNKTPFDLGTVGMARSSREPNSASCQFFICLSRQPSFDGEQTAFGYLVGEHSFETLRQIGAVPTGPKDRPLKPVYIQTISLENVPAREREIISANPPSRTPGVLGRPPEEASGPAASPGGARVQSPEVTTRPAGDGG